VRREGERRVEHKSSMKYASASTASSKQKGQGCMATDATVFKARGWMLVTKPLSLVKNLEREKKRKAPGLGFRLKSISN
jgi:hypothetical protein